MIVTVDLRLADDPGRGAAGLIDRPAGLAIVDPGPTSTMGALQAGLEARGRTIGDVEALLVTHIHLDHSGSVGTLVRMNPKIRVFVHERGARHIQDPSRLIESATRLYGEHMDRLWGEIVPVDAANVQVLTGGEVLRVAGSDVRVAYTPGHAWHHVSFFDEGSGTAFVGDVGGVRFGSYPFVFPPMPPPDIDLDAWDASLERIRAWDAARVFVTHFGCYDGAAVHLRILQERLHETASIARALLAEDGLDDEQRQARFTARVLEMFERDITDPEVRRRYATATPLDHCWQGLVRYWRTRSQGA